MILLYRIYKYMLPKDVRYKRKAVRLVHLSSCFLLLFLTYAISSAQVPVVNTGHLIESSSEDPTSKSGEDLLEKYIDHRNGTSVDEAVKYALAHNGELLAVRAEVEAAKARIKQASQRANPMLEASRSEQIRGMDSELMASISIPLELGGRRSARINLAQREMEMKELMLADRERMLAAEVREKFGRTLAEIRKLDFTEELLTINRRDYELINARVTEGQAAPLERNMVVVELNRVRSMREMQESKVEVAMLDLRNRLGMRPEEPLKLRGELKEPEQLPSLSEAVDRALKERPDILAARAAERVAEAMIEQARAEGRIDASLMAGYQRMRSGFHLKGIDEMGELAPIEMTSHSVVGGIKIDLPIRNRNQGEIAAAIYEMEAAQKRREFTELSVRREVASAYAQYERSMRALAIFRTGVLGEARENLKVVHQTYELGAKPLMDYIAEQRRFVEVENGFVDALLETYMSHLEIQEATNSPGLIIR
jgi:outer membrane protein, heavy metal efflux system